MEMSEIIPLITILIAIIRVAYVTIDSILDPNSSSIEYIEDMENI